MNHIHFRPADIPAIKAWYVKAFGANPGRRPCIACLGFEVTSLDAFVAGLEAKGIHIEAPIRQVPGTGLKIAFLADPWGTYIELTEGLAPR